jgi:hypothetical protein
MLILVESKAAAYQHVVVVWIIMIIIIILIHYHKGLRAEGVSLPSGSLGLHDPHIISCVLCPVWMYCCAKPSRKVAIQEQEEEGVVR